MKKERWVGYISRQKKRSMRQVKQTIYKHKCNLGKHFILVNKFQALRAKRYCVTWTHTRVVEAFRPIFGLCQTEVGYTNLLHTKSVMPKRYEHCLKRTIRHLVETVNRKRKQKVSISLSSQLQIVIHPFAHIFWSSKRRNIAIWVPINWNMVFHIKSPKEKK